MIIASQLMNTNTPVLSFDSSVEQVISFFKNNKENFAVVQASSDRVHGVITEAALMKMFLRQQAKSELNSIILFRDLFEPAQLIHEKEILPEVTKKVLTAVGHRVFVINDKGILVGYITARDVLPVLVSNSSEVDESKKLSDNDKSQLYLYESFFAKSPFMMHSVNQDGEIQMANEILHSVLGYKYGELIGKTIFDLYPVESHKYAEQGIHQIFEKGYHKSVKGKMVRKDRVEIDVELVSRALSDQKDNVIGTITVSRPLDMQYLLNCLDPS